MSVVYLAAQLTDSFAEIVDSVTPQSSEVEIGFQIKRLLGKEYFPKNYGKKG